MLTITDLIAVISLCATFYSLGYVRGKHDSKTQKKPPNVLRKLERLFNQLTISGEPSSVAPFYLLY